MDGKPTLDLAPAEIAAAFSDPLYAERFPPVLTTAQNRGITPDTARHDLPAARAGCLIDARGRSAKTCGSFATG